MEIKVVGGACGYHGPYTFYKGLRISRFTPTPTKPISGGGATATTTSASATALRINNSEINSNKVSKCVYRKLSSSDNLGGNSGGSISDDVMSGYGGASEKSDRGVRSGKSLVIALGDCIPVRPWSDSTISCLAELRMVWKDKNEQCLLTGLRLYFLPENTPLGRNCHGEDEVIAISDKVIIRADDLMTWVADDIEWNWGLKAIYSGNKTSATSTNKSIKNNSNRCLLRNSHLDFTDVEMEKHNDQTRRPRVTVLSYSRYCRYRATLKRLETIQDDSIRNTLIEVLSGFIATSSNTRIMFCKDTFDYPELETHDLLCNHLAPKLSGRPRGRRKKTASESLKRNESPVSDSSEASECSVKARIKPEITAQLGYNKRPTRTKNRSECSETPTPQVKKKPIKLTVRKTTSRCHTIVKNEDDYDDDDDFVDELVKEEDEDDITNKDEEEDDDQEEEESEKENIIQAKKIKEEKSKPKLNKKKNETKDEMQGISPAKIEERNFLQKLHEVLRIRKTPVPKVIWLGLKDVNLLSVYKRVQELGGYETVTTNKQWKTLFHATKTPNQNTMTRKKYERVLLPLELHEYKIDTKTTPEIVIKSEKIVAEPEEVPAEQTVESATKEVEKIPEVQIPLKAVTTPPPTVASPPAVIKEEQEAEEEKEPELTVEEIIEIQKKVKAKDVPPPLPPPVTSSHVTLPVTVIVGSPKSTTTSDANGNSSSSSSSQIQIKQPHTTITVHQTTIHPQISPKNSSNQIQITNQIQIQQITVQPNGNTTGSTTNNSEIQYNIKQDGSGQEIQIQSSPRRSDITVEDYTKGMKRQHSMDEFSTKKPSTLRHVRVTKDFNGRRTPIGDNNEIIIQNENIPMMLKQRMTTITPIMNGGGDGANVVTAGKRSESPEIIDLMDSDSENSGHSKKACPVKKRKLEILREGGLEVTPIHSSNPPVVQPIKHMIPEITTIPIMSKQPSTSSVRKTSGESSKNYFMNPPPKTAHLSIPKPEIGASSTSVPSSSKTQNLPPASHPPNHIPPPSFQSGCMFTKTSKIFGNPKDTYPLPPEPAAPRNIPKSSYSSHENILDLTIKKTGGVLTKSVEIVKIPVVKHNRSTLPPAMHPPVSHNLMTQQQPMNLNFSNSASHRPSSNSYLPTNYTPSAPKAPPVRDSHKSKSKWAEKPAAPSPMTHVQHIHQSQNFNINKKKPYETERPKKPQPTSSATTTSSSSTFQPHYSQPQYHLPSPHLPSPHAPHQPHHQPQTSPSTPTKPTPAFSPMNVMSTSQQHPAQFLSSMPPHPSSSAMAQHHARQMSQYLPFLDPLYMSALYANQGIQFFPPHLPPEILQYYSKNLPQGIVPITKS